nr:hypothetical protein [Tanacetum cinerariifolium]
MEQVQKKMSITKLLTRKVITYTWHRQDICVSHLQWDISGIGENIRVVHGDEDDMKFVTENFRETPEESNKRFDEFIRKRKEELRRSNIIVFTLMGTLLPTACSVTIIQSLWE